MNNHSTKSNKSIAIWCPVPFALFARYESVLVKKIHRCLPDSFLSCSLGYSHLSVSHLRYADLILILLPNDQEKIREYLLMPLLRNKRFLYVICQINSRMPCNRDAIKKQLRVTETSPSVLCLSQSDLPQEDVVQAHLHNEIPSAPSKSVNLSSEIPSAPLRSANKQALSFCIPQKTQQASSHLANMLPKPVHKSSGNMSPLTDVSESRYHYPSKHSSGTAVLSDRNHAGSQIDFLLKKELENLLLNR